MIKRSEMQVFKNYQGYSTYFYNSSSNSTSGSTNSNSTYSTTNSPIMAPISNLSPGSPQKRIRRNVNNVYTTTTPTTSNDTIITYPPALPGHWGSWNEGSDYYQPVKKNKISQEVVSDKSAGARSEILSYAAGLDESSRRSAGHTFEEMVRSCLWRSTQSCSEG